MKLTAKLWNELYKPGQEVYYYPVLRSDFTPDERFELVVTETKSIAWEACGNYLISVVGKTGGVCLDHLVIKIEAIEKLRKESEALQVHLNNCKDTNHWMMDRYGKEVKYLQSRVNALTKLSK